jgi:hypothetical protein
VACNDLLPLPDNQNLGTNVSVNADNELFTFPQAGRYSITVNLNVQEPNQLAFSVEANGTPLSALTLGEVTGPTFLYGETAIVNLQALAALGLRVTCPSWWSSPVIFKAGAGTGLTVIRVE